MNLNCLQGVGSYDATQGIFGTDTKTSDPISYPTTISLRVISQDTASGPAIFSQYQDVTTNGVWENLDTITLTCLSTATDDNFVVQGMSSEPNDPRLFDDAELTMGGNGDLAQVTDIQSDVDLQLEFWNGNNYQMVPAAYNYGDDSGETVADAVASFEHNPSNGVIYSEIVQGSGNPCTACTIGQLYGSAQVATIAVSVTPTLSSGILSVWTPSSPESEASQTQFMYDAKILIYPGTYCVSVSDPSGKVFGTQTVAVSGGATLNVAMTSSTNSSAVIKSSANSCMSTVPIVTGPSSTTLPNVTFTRTFTFVAVCTAPCDVLFPGPPSCDFCGDSLLVATVAVAVLAVASVIIAYALVRNMSRPATPQEEKAEAEGA